MPPTALIAAIDAVRRRAKRLSVLYGVGIAVAAALGLLIAVVALDYVLNLYALPRLGLSVVALGAFAWCAVRYVARPATARLSRADVAGRLERAFPQFEDRLRSTINFAEGHVPGSAVLQQYTIDQATKLAGTVDLSRAVVAKPAVVSVASAAAALLLVSTLSVGLLDRHTLAIIAARLVTPFNAPAWPKNTRIDLTGDVPARVPVGQKIDVALTIGKGDKPSLKPIVYYQLDDGPVQQQFMGRGDGSAFASSLDARLDPAKGENNGETPAGGTLRVWVEAGDDRRELPPVKIVPRLAIRSILAAVTPPAYATNRPTQTQNMATGPVVTAEGSTVTLTVGFNKPLGVADPTLEDVTDAAASPTTQTTTAATQSAPIRWSRPRPNVATATFAAGVSRRFRVHATDADEFANTGLDEYELTVRPDANLSIQLENPRRSEERTAGAFVPLQAVAEDDNGVAEVAISVRRLQPSPKEWTLPLLSAGRPEKDVGWQPIDASPDRVRDRLNYQWELKQLNLTAGDVIEYSLVARDNYDLNGRRHEPVGTSKLRLTIVGQDELASRVTDELRSIRTQAGLVRTTQQRTRQDTLQLDADTKGKPHLDAGDQSVASRLTQQQASAAASAKQLADRVQQAIDRLTENRSTADDLKQVTGDVRDTLNQTAEGDMKDATEGLTNAAQKGQPADARSQQLGETAKKQQSALDQLDKVGAKLDTIGSLQSTLGEINAILAEQRALRKANEDFAKTNLGKKPEDLSEADKKTLDAIADRQDKVAQRTQKATESMGKQAEQMKRNDPSTSDAMAAAAKQAADSKAASNAKRASEQTKQNQQSNAQQSQQQVELGLEQVLAELKQAQERELARLREQLTQLQEQVALLVRRQSGHNLDALLLQGPDKLKAAGPKLLATLTEDAKRKPQDLKAPEARLVSSGQELTGRNTRDIAAGTDAKPATAEIGALLGKAAGQMERAIASLRDGKVAEGYDPHQVEALAALHEAQAKVDQQKQQADQKKQEQQKEAIRARYVKLRDREKTLAADTSKADKAPAVGMAGRVRNLTLAKLSKDQTDVGDETAKIEPDLETLGSIVYVWANRDIKSAMDGVATQLAAAQSGIPTQAEQGRVVDELDAMIKNLEEKPPEQKFEQANQGANQGGGGQGQPKPKMPTEVELKLLKSLQVAVNTSTTKIAAVPKPDAPVLAKLGGRQGELRNLLDSLLKKASNGKTGLGNEPDNKNQLPEEATADDADQTDLENSLLGGDAGKSQDKVDQGFQLVGTRMARSRQRLALNSDPGKITQEVQKRILSDLDQLIDMAHKNGQQQQQQQQASSSGQNQGQPKPSDQQANNAGQNKPGQQVVKNNNPGAVNNNAAAAGEKAHDLKDLTEKASEWGNVTARMRQAVIDSRGEDIVQQYQKLIEDYYGALSDQNGKKR